MPDSEVARFEFRTFGIELGALRRALAARGEGAAQPLSREHYIVTRRNAEANVKTRRGRLEVKGLVGRLGLLEQWRPVLSEEFPVAAAVVENVVVPALGLDIDLAGCPPFTERALLDWAEAQPDLAHALVEKRRTLYDLGDCRAEFAELAIEGDRLQTVAMESAEAGTLGALVAELGLTEAQNKSYPALLQRRMF